MSSAGNGSATLTDALRRLEELTGALHNAPPGNAREMARELLELVLDLHGLALARMTSLASASEQGPGLIESMIADPYVRGVLLLHGLHPHEPELRLRQTIEQMRPQWNSRGFHVDLISADSTTARIRVNKNGSGEATDAIRLSVEEALVDVAPDLDDIAVEISESVPAAAAELAR